MLKIWYLGLIDLLMDKGYSLLETVIVIAISAILITIFTFGAWNFKTNSDFEAVQMTIVEKIGRSKSNAISSILDDLGARSPYGIKILSNKITEFVGTIYEEGVGSNIEYQMPVGFSLESLCSPNNNGEMVFAPLTGENLNTCDVFIYQGDNLKSTIHVGKYGIENVELE